MNSASAISLSDIPEISMSTHPWWNHHLQYGVLQPIAHSFSLPLNTVRHFAQNGIDPPNVSVVWSTSDESSYTIASESLLSESEDDVLSNFFGALHFNFGLGAASAAIAVAFAFSILVFSFSFHFFFTSSWHLFFSSAFSRHFLLHFSFDSLNFFFSCSFFFIMSWNFLDDTHLSMPET